MSSLDGRFRGKLQKNNTNGFKAPFSGLIQTYSSFNTSKWVG